jgi:hypothetical protein
MQDCALSLYYFAQLVLHVIHPAETELCTRVDARLNSRGCPMKSVNQTYGGSACCNLKYSSQINSPLLGG